SALQLLGQFEPALLESRGLGRERVAPVLQRDQGRVVVVRVGQACVDRGDLALQLVQSAVDGGELLLRGAPLGAREESGGCRVLRRLALRTGGALVGSQA